MRMNIKGTAIMIGGTNSAGAEGRRYSITPYQDRYNNTNNSLVTEALEKNSNNFDLINRQPLTTTALSAIEEFDGTNKSTAIP